MHAVNFVAGDKVVGRVTMERLRAPYPYALMLPQSETERLLEERLRQQGVEIERRVELTAFKTSDDGVEANAAARRWPRGSRIGRLAGRLRRGS